eukprot:5124279-Amphidinium_carterae.1
MGAGSSDALLDEVPACTLTASLQLITSLATANDASRVLSRSIPMEHVVTTSSAASSVSPYSRSTWAWMSESVTGSIPSFPSSRRGFSRGPLVLPFVACAAVSSAC